MWPSSDSRLQANGEDIFSAGEALIDIATAVRRYKSERNMALSAELKELQIVASDHRLTEILKDGESDLQSITRASRITLSAAPDPDLELLPVHALLQLGVRA
jgi:valyl-tRNA synthetase